MLSIRQLSFSYEDGLTPFSNLDLDIEEGKIVALVGPSGIGKSTLLKCIAGYLQANSGNIYLNDKRVIGPHEKLLPGHDDIALVNQDYKLDTYHTAEENIRNILLHLSKEDRNLFVNELLDLIDLNHRKDTQALFLSGGEKQRLALARALAKEPSVLLLDEPFSHLDIHLRRKVGRYIKTMSKLRNTTIILVTHEGEEALSWAEDLYFFDTRKVEKLGSPEEVYKNPKDRYQASFFGEVNSVFKAGKPCYFRPNQYSLKKTEGGLLLTLNFQRSEFRGNYFSNYFTTVNREELVLYSLDALNDLKQCYV